MYVDDGCDDGCDDGKAKERKARGGVEVVEVGLVPSI